MRGWAQSDGEAPLRWLGLQFFLQVTWAPREVAEWKGRLDQGGEK